MLVGLPASGKSTFREKFIRANPDHVVVSSDDFVEKRAAELGLTYSQAWESNIKMAEAHCRQVFDQTIRMGGKVLIDRTNMTLKSRKTWITPRTYTRTAFLFEVDPDVLDQRLRDRAAWTGKHIPEHVIRSMRSSYLVPSSDEFDIIARVVQ